MDTKKITTSTFNTVLNENELKEINGGFSIKRIIETYFDPVEKSSDEKNLNYNLHHLLRRIT